MTPAANRKTSILAQEYYPSLWHWPYRHSHSHPPIHPSPLITIQAAISTTDLERFHRRRADEAAELEEHDDAEVEQNLLKGRVSVHHVQTIQDNKVAAMHRGYHISLLANGAIISTPQVVRLKSSRS